MKKNDKYDFNKVFKYMYMLTKSWLHDSGTVETFVKECCQGYSNFSLLSETP